MADLFDALAARAMGTADPLTPPFAPMFAAPGLGSGELREWPAIVDVTAGPASDGDSPAAVPDPGIGIEPEACLALALPNPNPGNSTRVGSPSSAHGGEQPTTKDDPAAVHDNPGPSPGFTRVQPTNPYRATERAAASAAVDGLVVAPPPSRPVGLGTNSGGAVRSVHRRTPALARGLDPAPEAGAPQAAPQVTISIGHVEVRAPARPAAQPPKQPSRPPARISLDDYLRGGRR